MKTALIHYWLTNLRGGEKVLLELAGLFPDADLFTHACSREMAERFFQGRRIRESLIARLPGARRNCQSYLPLMPCALRQFDFSSYDLILSSESGPAKGIRKPPSATHICYCHTPMRYLWDMYDDYYRSTGIPGKIAMRLFRDPLRRYDLRSADAVDHFIANSRFVAERIRRIYGRESTVIHPPADVSFFRKGAYEKKGYYLFVGQLIDYKRADLALEACMKMNRRLLIVGEGNQLPALRKRAGKNICFRGRLEGEPLRRAYAEAEALLFPGIEDFGIVPLEAQAAGTPVIALGKGGALETVTPQTGLFFPKADVQSLCAAIEEFESKTFQPELLRTHAESFRPEVFRRNMRNFLKRVLPGLPLPDPDARETPAG